MAARLLARTIGQLLALFALLGAALFGVAGTLDFPHGWLWLGIFATASSAITAYLYRRDPALLERRLALAESGEPTRVQYVLQAIAGLAFAAMPVVAALDRRWQLAAAPTAAVVVGCVLLVAGFAIVFEVFRENTFASSVIAVAKDQRVIDTGLYARVRHPMYSGGLLVIVATPLVLGSLVALAPVPILVLAIWLRARDEERVLARDLPGYAEYMQRVRRRFVSPATGSGSRSPRPRSR
jgi:protein-S-isoprenylcysteine O-methyltransferase Ste14